jgi:hypothetical protein
MRLIPLPEGAEGAVSAPLRISLWATRAQRREVPPVSIPPPELYFALDKSSHGGEHMLAK